MTAKEFGARPSDYLPELGTYEAFCLDEACAHMLIHMREEARKEAEREIKGKAGTGDREPVAKGPVSLDWLKQQQEQFKQSGKYKL
ncbi:MAG: hypothetical protein HPY52_10805 [Firmicutes bacterium]|nr:hypothetical protein [Bacillota bacterium]